jgi:hypothetical protein
MKRSLNLEQLRQGRWAQDESEQVYMRNQAEGAFGVILDTWFFIHLKVTWNPEYSNSEKMTKLLPT